MVLKLNHVEVCIYTIFASYLAMLLDSMCFKVLRSRRECNYEYLYLYNVRGSSDILVRVCLPHFGCY